MRKMSRIAAATSILVLAALACGGGDRMVGPAPSKITIASGNNQKATPGSTLPIPLEVIVTSSDGVGIADVNVHWAVTAGAGTLSSSNTRTDANGLATVDWTLGSARGAQAVFATVVAVDAAASFNATGIPSVVVHYDGTAWTTSLADTSGGGLYLSSIWGASPSQVFADGKCASSLILMYQASRWSPPLANCSPGDLSEFTSVWGNTASDVFAVGRAPLPPSFNGWIVHYDGQTWTEVYRRACSFCGGLRAIWTSAANSAVAVGDAGEIRRYDGTNWNVQTSGTTNNLNAVWGIGTGTGVFAVGSGGTILYYDGSSWSTQTSGTTQPLYAIWGTSASDVFAVGGTGTILHYDGSSWTAVNSGATQTLRGIWGSSGSSIFVVGDGNTILFYDGTRWTPHVTGASISLRAVWGSSPTNVFAVGQPQ